METLLRIFEEFWRNWFVVRGRLRSGKGIAAIVKPCHLAAASRSRFGVEGDFPRYTDFS